MAQGDPAICEIRTKCRLLWAVMADRISVPGELVCSLPLPGLVPPAASLTTHCVDAWEKPSCRCEIFE
jgi:hypothetical protein